MAILKKKSAVVMYHYFHPDDVVSAQHFSDLCVGLTERGWLVTALPCNRGCRDESEGYVSSEKWKGILVRRIWRPNFPQSSSAGRMLNAAWMIAAWSLQAFFRRPDVLIIGSDPMFSVTVAIPWSVLRPRTKIVHWCLDMYPEAAIADGLVSDRHWTVRLMRLAMRRAYDSCDLIGSLGSCMDARLRQYTHNVPLVPITPWALVEPVEPLSVDPCERTLAFGEAKLGLMYSGNFGRAHDAELFVRLARLLRNNASIRFVFSVRGNRVADLKRMVTVDDTNITFLDFAPQERLERRLSAADIHLVSLREGFSGTVVPSKFQGAIAAGRPILFSGDPTSAVAGWIKQHRIGWVIDTDNLGNVAAELAGLCDEPKRMIELRMHCLSVYRQHFSQQIIIDRFDNAIRAVGIS